MAWTDLRKYLSPEIQSERGEVISVGDGTRQSILKLWNAPGFRFTASDGSRGALRPLVYGGNRVARGAYVAFTDDGCVLPPDWLSKLFTPLENGTVAIMGGTHAEPPKTLRGS